MSENLDRVIRVREGQCSPQNYASTGDGIPNAHELDMHYLPKRSLEPGSELNSWCVRALV
jgi:hypothetical protein